MTIIRKWDCARAELITDELVCWIAETRANTGTWVIREGLGEGNEAVIYPEIPGTADSIIGAMFPFDDELQGQLLVMTQEQREALGMPLKVYEKLNDMLRYDLHKRREACVCCGRSRT